MRRGDAGAVGGVSAMVRRKPSDFATPVLDRMACTASEFTDDFWGGVLFAETTEDAPLSRGALAVGNGELDVEKTLGFPF